MPWQQHVADVAMEMRPDGTLQYERVVVTVQRQAGKTTLILPVFVHRSVAEFPGNRLDVGPQKQTVVYTAQTRNDARKKWIKEFTPILEKSGFRTEFEKRLTNGGEGFDWSNGSTFDLVATMEKSGHGDTLDLGIIDEAFAQVDDRLEQAMEPATLTRTSSQLWIISTAGENNLKSPFLWSEVEAGRAQVEAGVETRTAYFEWSLFPDDDPDDIDVVASRHPGVGYTITVEDLRGKHQRAVEKDKLDGFRRAYCNVWGTVATQKPSKLPADAWAATAVDQMYPIEPGAVTLAFDVSKDGEASSISVGAGDLTAPFVATIDDRSGVGWLPEELVRLVQKWEPIAVGVNAAGAAGAQVGSILEAFRAAGIPADLLVPMSAGEYTRACGGFYTDVTEGRLTRLIDGVLDRAGSEAAERTIGAEGGWAWDRRSATVSIAPLVAATIARALLPTEVTPDLAPFFAFT